MDLDELTRNQQLALVALVEELAMSDGTISAGEEKEIGKLSSELGEAQYRELLEEANERIPDQEALKRTLTAITHQQVRETILGTAMEEILLTPSAKHEQWALIEWLKDQWNIKVDTQNRKPAEGDPST